MHPKRKLMILQTRYIESISYLSAELTQAFPSDKYEVTMVYLESGIAKESDSSAYKCVCLNLRKEDYNGLRLKAIRRLKAFFNEHDFDVIVANMYKPINLLMQLSRVNKAKLCVGIIHTFGEFDRLGRRLMMRWMMEPRWKIVGVSQPVCDYLINSNCGLNKSNTLVINNAINLEKVSAGALTKCEAKKILKLPDNGLVFGTVGRCVKGKRHLELVKAFHQFMKEGKQAYLVVIGDGELYEELSAYVTAYQLQECVYLVGYLPNAVSYLNALDIFVLPSESEGFSIALLEAMALSLPVIVNQMESLTSVIMDPEAEVDSLNINEMARLLQFFYEMPVKKRFEKGINNFNRAKQFYDIANYKKSFGKLVDDHFLDQNSSSSN